jgi:hypothetical protein
VEVPVDLLHHRLDAFERRGQLAGIRQEALFTEGAEGMGVTILRPPSLGHLPHAEADAIGLRLAVERHESVRGRLDRPGRDRGTGGGSRTIAPGCKHERGDQQKGS